MDFGLYKFKTKARYMRFGVLMFLIFWCSSFLVDS